MSVIVVHRRQSEKQKLLLLESQKDKWPSLQNDNDHQCSSRYADQKDRDSEGIIGYICVCDTGFG